MDIQQLQPQDAAFLYMETPANPSHVLAFMIFDPSTASGGAVTYPQIFDHVASRAHTSDLYRRRLVHLPLELDYPYWEDDPFFNLEYHIHHQRLPAPADWRQLCQTIARYHTQPMNLDRPPWEMVMIEGLDNVEGIPAGCFAIATKIHHVAVDGASATAFFTALMDRDAEGTPQVDISRMKTQPCAAPGLLTRAGRAVVNNVRSPLRVARSLIGSVPQIAQMATRRMSDGGEDQIEVPYTRFNQPLTPHKVFDGFRVALDDLKAIRKAVPGATVNDAVLAVTSGGLRRYLQAHDELPGDPLVAWIPVNARAAGTEDSSGNDISAMTAPLHTQLEDPLARLAAITESTRASKSAESGQGARLMTDLSRHVPAPSQALAAKLMRKMNSGYRMCNLFVSNVPGAPVPQFMAGARGVINYALGPLNNGMGLFIATPSYNGQMSFGVTSTREILPDVDFFVDCLRESFDELKQVAAAPASSKRTSSISGRKKISSRKASAKKTGRKKSTTRKAAGKKSARKKKT